MMEKIDELEQIPLHFVSENHEKSFQKRPQTFWKLHKMLILG